MSFVDVTYEEAESFQRTDLTPYREVFNNLKTGIQATLVVWTGPINEKGKGEDALKHDRAFRAVAKERNVGLSVGHTNMPDGQTRLRLMVGPKRVIPPESLKKRQIALEKSRIQKAVDKKMIEHPEYGAEKARQEVLTERKAAYAARAAAKKS